MGFIAVPPHHGCMNALSMITAKKVPDQITC
jgi:hypothetical protein